MNKETKKDIINVWKWLAIKDELKPCDIIFLFGSPSLETPRKGAKLFYEGLVPYIVCTGFAPIAEKNPFDTSLAEAYARELLKLKVPKDKILIQNKSTNTPEDIKFAMQILRKENIACKSAILIASTYHQRRVFATFKKMEPKIELINCPRVEIDEMMIDRDNSRYSIRDSVINEYEKLKIYGEKGDLVLQPPPKKVQDSYHILKLSNR